MIIFIKHNNRLIDQQLLPLNGSSMSGMYFLIFASCEPLKQLEIRLVYMFSVCGYNTFLLQYLLQYFMQFQE